ncbi:MAG: acetate kinase [Isosphaeraceae bacterium]|jgi:acetate kinase|nr:MAG: acetate kinase [Isosphaeraceae bacterium]
MNVLVANLGSTSFKYRLYDLGQPSEPLLSRGAIDRIGSGSSSVRLWLGDREEVFEAALPDHGAALQVCLNRLSDPASGVLRSAEDLGAIGFKAVHSRDYHGVHRVDAAVLDSMEAYSAVAPAHNPPYVKAMRALAERFPQIPQVAAFETAFHATIPDAQRYYAIPEAWSQRLGIQRWGFHGASHRYIAERVAQLLGREDLRVVSCHLGGSSSLCAIRNGRSQACSLGMSPQTGLPHNNRVGDFDVFALPAILRETGQTLEEVLETLASRSGLEGVCGHRDLRDIEAAAEAGDRRSRLALELYVGSIRHYLGAYLFELGGADAIVFTGGIGENSRRVREAVLRDLDWFGIELDPQRNASARGEALVSTDASRVQIWTVPTNEELIVARQTRDLLRADGGRSGSGKG